jgi:hypothetical protein
MITIANVGWGLLVLGLIVLGLAALSWIVEDLLKFLSLNDKL